jgi:hypothetical protein
MNATHSFLPPPQVLRRLAAFLQETGSQLSPGEAAAIAINQWIATERGQLNLLTPTPTRGYQWKSLFLPEGTELRINFAGISHFARVVGDHIIYGGQRLSPRQMAIDVAGRGRNAWREISVLLPGERKWLPASRLRREAEQEGKAPPVSPVEAMTAAAACMSETLKTALALVEHANGQALPAYERRGMMRLRGRGGKPQEGMPGGEACCAFD